MSNLYKCDLCGALIEELLKVSRLEFSNRKRRERVRLFRYGESYDLCDGCANKVEKFIKENKNK